MEWCLIIFVVKEIPAKSEIAWVVYGVFHLRCEAEECAKIARKGTKLSKFKVEEVPH